VAPGQERRVEHGDLADAGLGATVEGGIAPARPRPNASRASSPMPASEPSTPAASMGKMSVFWFGLRAKAASASGYR
jgi:hypothetical protein